LRSSIVLSSLARLVDSRAVDCRILSIAEMSGLIIRVEAG
jgi:hypothetical protein